jgi:hypothetical protein
MLSFFITILKQKQSKYFHSLTDRRHKHVYWCDTAAWPQIYEDCSLEEEEEKEEVCFTVSTCGRLDHDGCTAEKGITEGTVSCNKNNPVLYSKCVTLRALEWRGIGFYTPHWFVLGSSAPKGVRKYLVKYMGSLKNKTCTWNIRD